MDKNPFFLRVLIDNLPRLFVCTLKIYCQLKGVIVCILYVPLDIFLRYLVMWFLVRRTSGGFCFRLPSVFAPEDFCDAEEPVLFLW